LDGPFYDCKSMTSCLAFEPRADGGHRDAQARRAADAGKQDAKPVDLRRHRTRRKAEAVAACVLNHPSQSVWEVRAVAKVAVDVIGDDELDLRVRHVGHGRDTAGANSDRQSLAGLERSHADGVGRLLAASAIAVMPGLGEKINRVTAAGVNLIDERQIWVEHLAIAGRSFGQFRHKGADEVAPRCGILREQAKLDEPFQDASHRRRGKIAVGPDVGETGAIFAAIGYRAENAYGPVEDLRALCLVGG